MKKAIKKFGAIAAGLILATVALTGCESDADKVSENIAIEAEAFNVQRTIVATSGVTGANLLYVEGRCSFETSGKRIDLTCKYGPDQYRKHTMLFGDLDSIYVAMEEPIDVSEYHTKIIVKPQNIIPEFDISIGEDE